jgi:Ca2+-binding RTX toxin-like protein
MFSFTQGRNAALKIVGAAAFAAALWSASPADAAPKKCFGHDATIVSNEKRIKGTNHDDVIVAGAGSQRITGGAGRDLICADGGNDRVDGGAGRDRIDGDIGNDRLNGGSEADLITGNRGNDVIQGASNSGDTEDVLTGGSGDDLLHGGDGSDVLFDGPGSDVVNGDGQDDRLVPQDDMTPDRYSGGSSVDKIDYTADEDSSFRNGVTVSLDGAANDGVNCPQQCEGDNAGADIENISGSNGDDTLIGNDASNVIEDFDYSGRNTISGLGGADIVRSSDANDAVAGGAGDDRLESGSGDDTVDGGEGTDDCYGGAGTDTAAACESEIGFP